MDMALKNHQPKSIQIEEEVSISLLSLFPIADLIKLLRRCIAHHLHSEENCMTIIPEQQQPLCMVSALQRTHSGDSSQDFSFRSPFSRLYAPVDDL